MEVVLEAPPTNLLSRSTTPFDKTLRAIEEDQDAWGTEYVIGRFSRLEEKGEALAWRQKLIRKHGDNASVEGWIFRTGAVEEEVDVEDGESEEVGTVVVTIDLLMAEYNPELKTEEGLVRWEAKQAEARDKQRAKAAEKGAEKAPKRGRPGRRANVATVSEVDDDLAGDAA